MTNQQTFYAQWQISVPIIFNYTGGIQTYTVPFTGNYLLDAYGAQGGAGGYGGQANVPGGLGGRSYGYIYLTEGTVLYICVGGTGEYSTWATAAGGYNGGGAGYSTGSNYPRSGGGGATHIGLRNSTLREYGNTDGLYIVAGGGGAGGRLSAGAGGGESGGNGTGSYTTYHSSGYGGTQFGPGLNGFQEGVYGFHDAGFGYGGGDNGTTSALKAGGGGGLYGGGCGVADFGDGGGGSGWIHPDMWSAKMMNGQRVGNGIAYIQFIGIP